MMTYRLYFWFKNVEADRPGGPWWYMDFQNPPGFGSWGKEQMARFFSAAKPFLHAWAFTEGVDLPRHHPMEVTPLFGLRIHTWEEYAR